MLSVTSKLYKCLVEVEIWTIGSHLKRDHNLRDTSVKAPKGLCSCQEEVRESVRPSVRHLCCCD